MMQTVFMDLSNAYHCTPHGLLKAKLNAYGTDSVALLLISDHLSRCKQRMKKSLVALVLIFDYLSRCKQRTKKGTFYNFWHGIR